MLPGFWGGPCPKVVVTTLEIFLELLGKGIFSIVVALLIKCKSETPGGHLVTTWDKHLESAMPEAKYLLMYWLQPGLGWLSG